MKKTKMAIACVAAASLLLSACGTDIETYPLTGVSAGEEAEEEIWTYDGQGTTTARQKDESVSVKADAQGNPTEITVSTKLSKISGDSTVLDLTNLTDIKNKSGDEQFEADGENIYWENLGEEISYEGTSTEQLPVTVKISYYLDGEEVAPEEIAGKSGDVKIRFDYEINEIAENPETDEASDADEEADTGERDDTSGSVRVPFMFMSALILSEDHFSDIEVENGSVMDMDDSQIVVGYAMPSLADDLGIENYESLEDVDIPEYVEISAKAEDFEIGFTETIVKSGIFTKIEDGDIVDLKDMTDDMEDLGEAGDELSDAAGKLESGFSELQSAVSSYLDGVSSISSSISDLSEGAKTLSKSSGKLASGAKDLSDALSGLQEQLAAAGVSLPEDVSTQLAGLSEAAKQLSDGMSALDGGIDELKSGAKQLAKGAKSAADNNDTIKDAFSEYKSGLSEFADGVDELNDDGLQKLSDKLGTNGKEIVEKIEKLREADESYKTFTKLSDGQDGSVSFIIETEGI